MRVAILDDVHGAYAATEGVRRLRERADVTIFERPYDSPVALRGYDAIVTNRERTRLTRAFFEALPGLRIVAQTGNHAYHVDFAAAAAHGVVIAKAAGGFSTGAAELAIGLALAVVRGIPAGDRGVREGGWPAPLGLELADKTMGIVGLGHVGRHVARLANAFGMHVLAWGRTLDAARAAEAGVEAVKLDELLERADIVSIHATLAPETRGLIDARRLALMKPTAFLVNTARGPIVDERSLVDALSQRHIAGAALDVFDVEPLPPGHPLAALPNVVLTPHLGWPTDRKYAQFADAAADVLIAWLDGHDVPRFVDRSHA
jgi:phosphoglycerate dehydrogenase-like enzyme